MAKTSSTSISPLMMQSFFLIPLIIMLIITYLSAFDKHGKPVCDRYILNSYLYAVTYLVMMAWFISLVILYDYSIENMNLFVIIGLAILAIVLVFIIYSIPKEMVLLKHSLSVLFIGISALFLSFIFKMFEIKSIIFFIVMTIILFIILTGITWKYQDMISSRISFTLLIVFIILLVIELLIGIFFPGTIFEKAIILIVLIVLCYLLLVKTKKMIEDSRTCIADKGPDYVNNGVSLVISFESILIRLLELFGKKKKIGRR